RRGERLRAVERHLVSLQVTYARERRRTAPLHRRVDLELADLRQRSHERRMVLEVIRKPGGLVVRWTFVGDEIGTPALRRVLPRLGHREAVNEHCLRLRGSADRHGGTLEGRQGFEVDL